MPLPAVRLKPTALQQFGALPYRFGPEGVLQVLLITSRTTRRWIVPKGWPVKHLKPAMAAAREAYEEAGVRGKTSRAPIGAFNYVKLLDGDGRAALCEVKVFALRVTHQCKRWPEQKEREARWMQVEEAAALVTDDSLRALLHEFASSLAPKA